MRMYKTQIIFIPENCEFWIYENDRMINLVNIDSYEVDGGEMIVGINPEGNKREFREYEVVYRE